ncbi:MAG: CDP-archaeol synthase [Nanoarchaeota archaeon]
MIGLFILKALYFFLPAYIANMAPVLVKKVPFLNRPVHEKRFGSHKTWRGLVAAVLAGGLVFWLQKIAYTMGFRSLAVIDYHDFSVLLGFLLGAGAILGDLVKSYYKRKGGIKPGHSWIPFDQLDFVIGGIIGSFFLYVPPASIVLVLLIVSPVLHALFHYMGYLLKMNEKRW